MEYIRKKDLEKGAYYKCEARNFEIGKWNGEAFEYTRKKFGFVNEDIEYHYDDGPPYGTVKPLEKVKT